MANLLKKLNLEPQQKQHLLDEEYSMQYIFLSTEVRRQTPGIYME